MAHHFYLPQLSGENISVPKEYGHWNNNDRKIILGISDAIAIDEQAQTRGVSSIPDIWARPLLFQSAIRPKSNHPLKNLCIQEWRGLLSLLALHKVLPILKGLKIIPVNLDNERFSTALNNLVPSPVQLEKQKKYSWTDILMVRFGDLPLGAFSPTTLVYSATGYHKELKEISFPFKDENGFLCPPATREQGLEYVGEWVDNLRIQLNDVFFTDQVNPDHQVVGNINTLLEEWLKEIRATLGLKSSERIDSNKYKVDSEMTEIKSPAPFLDNYNVYQILLHALKQDETSKNRVVSDILLQSERQNSVYKDIIVITEKLLSADVNIWGEIRPKALGDSAKVIIEKFFKEASGTKIDQVDIGAKGAMWIRPELYFLSDNILKTSAGPILDQREEYLNIKTNYVLPFKKEVLDFFSTENIKDQLQPFYKDEEEGIIKFSFILPVGDRTEKIEKIFRTKSLMKGEGEITETAVPVLEIFPDNLGANWRRYYLFNGNADRFSALPLIHNSSNVKFLSNPAKEYAGKQLVQTIEISGDNCFPEAVEISNEKKNPLGLILLDKKKEDQGLKKTWTVGIDFGTSNTNVYKKIDDNPPTRWKYNFPAYYRTLTASSEQARHAILEERFFPQREVNLPIPSTLKVYNFAKKENLVLDYFIFYPREYMFPENVLSDIKWDSEEERKTEYFLESLLFLLLIEVVKEGAANVILACSFPKAFSNGTIQLFEKEWTKVFKKLLGNDSEFRVVNVYNGRVEDAGKKMKILKPQYQTEGVAAGHYFANLDNAYKKAKIDIAAICLDVGGGTTDISLWYRKEIEFDVSVLLAGRQISDILQKNTRVTELLFSKAAAQALQEKKDDKKAFAARLNLVLKNEEDEIQNMLIKYANHKDVIWLRQILTLEFAALSYFTAMACVAVDIKTDLGLLSRIGEKGINLHWGGNAAKLINWIDFGGKELDPNGNASKLLNAVFFNCLSSASFMGDKAIKPKSLSQLQSPEHKSEASGGLVSMKWEDHDNEEDTHESKSSFQDQMEEYSSFQEFPDPAGETADKYKGVIAGENIELRDKTVKAFDFLSHKDLFDKTRTHYKNTDLSHLLHFISILNFFGIKYSLFTEDTKINLSDREKQIIQDNVEGAFIEMEKTKEGSRLIEPIFIMEVKFLLDLLKSKMK